MQYIGKKCRKYTGLMTVGSCGLEACIVSLNKILRYLRYVNDLIFYHMVFWAICQISYGNLMSSFVSYCTAFTTTTAYESK